MTIEISEETVLLALMKTVFKRDPETGSYSQEASQVLGHLTYIFRDNEEVKNRLEGLIVESLPDLVPMALDKMLSTMIQENSPGYNQPKKVMLASWAQRPLEEALAIALRDHAEDYVHERMPEGILDRYDMVININLVPK
jgi:hypothetical protein